MDRPLIFYLDTFSYLLFLYLIMARWIIIITFVNKSATENKHSINHKWL